jgi:hypothetical protein
MAGDGARTVAERIAAGQGHDPRKFAQISRVEGQIARAARAALERRKPCAKTPVD